MPTRRLKSRTVEPKAGFSPKPKRSVLISAQKCYTADPTHTPTTKPRMPDSHRKKKKKHASTHRSH
jgi:hypothetical protein